MSSRYRTTKMADLPAVLQSEIERRLQRRQRSGEVTILDGGTGTCLWELLGGTTQSTLWSARLLADNPLAIYNVRCCASTREF